MTGGLDRLPVPRTPDVLTRLPARSPGDDFTSCLPLPGALRAPCGQPGPTLALTSVQVNQRRYHVAAPDPSPRPPASLARQRSRRAATAVACGTAVTRAVTSAASDAGSGDVRA